MLKERIPETDETGGAILDMENLDMAAYSRFCKKYLAREYRRIVGFFKDELRVNPSGSILEVGSGPGWISIFLAQALPNSKIIALELSKDMRRIAEENQAASGVTNVVFEPGNAESMPFDTNSFDGVISNGSLHHWVQPIAVFNEVRRVLKPDGVYAIFDGRRDLGALANLLHQVFSGIAFFDPTVPGRQMRRGWRTSIDAGYTPSELRGMVVASDIEEFVLQEALFDLILHSPMQPAA